MTTTFYDHWREAPEDAWRWPNFSPAEIACRGTGKLLINAPALDKLQDLRDWLGKPLIVRGCDRPSGRTCEAFGVKVQDSPCDQNAADAEERDIRRRNRESMVRVAGWLEPDAR